MFFPQRGDKTGTNHDNRRKSLQFFFEKKMNASFSDLRGWSNFNLSQLTLWLSTLTTKQLNKLHPASKQYQKQGCNHRVKEFAGLQQNLFFLAGEQKIWNGYFSLNIDIVYQIRSMSASQITNETSSLKRRKTSCPCEILPHHYIPEKTYLIAHKLILYTI